MRTVLPALVASAAFLIGCEDRGREAARAASPSPASGNAAAPDAPAPDPRRLVGRWLRADADYVIEVAGVGPGGAIEAAYFNPGPIHVSRAAWKSARGTLALAVELTDRGYPGNFYALFYDPGSDALIGEYHHLGVNETYEVVFSRAAASAP